MRTYASPPRDHTDGSTSITDTTEQTPDRRGAPEGLRPRALRPLPLGELRPHGWLADQLQLQVDGMAGHLDEIWADVGDSAWLGGSADGWERGPYWLDALVPLAMLTGDQRLQDKARRWVDALLDAQDEDGWIAPIGGEATDQHQAAGGHQDIWPRMVILKALLQYHSATRDPRIVPAAVRLCRHLETLLRRSPLHEWGRARWADLVHSIDELYELTGETRLLELADLAHEQGYPWSDFADELPYREKVGRDSLLGYQEHADGTWFNDGFLSSHGVNVAMGLKAMPVWWRHGADMDADRFTRILEQLDAYHGQATGLFTCDEHLAGVHPSQGTETCAVAEYLFSLEVALEVWGMDETVIDRWERIAFNALPASATETETGHQYDQQANQVICHVTEDRVYTNNGPDANTFGFSPHFACCTANRHQGWPKFAARTWMRSDDGLVALSYVPCSINAHIGGRRVAIEVHGTYPFGDTVTIEVTVDGPATFPIDLRIPAWVVDGTATVDGTTQALTAGSVLRLERTWHSTHRIELQLPATVAAIRRPSDAVSLRRGPLLFTLAVQEEWHRIGGEPPYEHWEVHPRSPWNYALVLDPANPDADVTHTLDQLDGRPFARGSTPIRLHARARRVPTWQLEHGAAAPPPPSPVTTHEPIEDVTLLPYGAARLRVTDLPWTTTPSE